MTFPSKLSGILRRKAAETVQLTCPGDCFDIGTPNLESIRGGTHHAVEQAVSHREDYTPSLLYSKLETWQTRVIRLPSVQEHSFATTALKVDLLVVNLLAIEGVTLQDTSTLINYTALSYTWGSGIRAYELKCNDKVLPITRNLAHALSALQQEDKPLYLWADLICIDQSNIDEQAQQVAKMLTIFNKAAHVIAWLGEPDMDSVLAFHATRNLEKLMLAHTSAHSPQCLAQLQALNGALTGMYNRPWLSRTWIRQEIFAAERLTVHCGADTLNWQQFLKAADTMASMRRHLQSKGMEYRSPNDDLPSLLREASLNSAKPAIQYRAPRALVDVLLASRHFHFSREHDVVYAVLGMCAVPVDTSPSLEQSAGPSTSDAITVDYRKTPVQVYHDASVYLVQNGRSQDFAGLWHYYQRCPEHEEGLPTWAAHWRKSLCPDREILIIRSEVEQILPSLSGDWEVPRVSPLDTRILDAKVKFLNYIAYLSPYTCDLETFLNQGLMDFELGRAGRTIHCSPRPNHFPLLFKHLPRPPTLFHKEKHIRRIAILGCATEEIQQDLGSHKSVSSLQIALVPATAQKGDLVATFSPSPCMFVLRPLDGTNLDLVPSPDAYENLRSKARISSLVRAAESLVFKSGSLSTYGTLIFACGCWIGFPVAIGVVSEVRLRVILGSVYAGLGCVFLAFCLHVYADVWRRSSRRRVINEMLDRATHQTVNFEFHGPLFLKLNLDATRLLLRQLAGRPVQSIRIH